MTLAFVVAQLLDLATYSAATEANPLVVALGVLAPLVKVALILGVLLIVRCVPPLHGRVVLSIGVLVGLAGALSNTL